MTSSVLLLALVVGAAAGGSAEELPSAVTLRGRVIDAQTGEPIAKALVTVRGREMEAVTDAAGRFVLAGMPAGELEVVVVTVGYGPARRTVAASRLHEELEVRLSQEALRRAEEVSVTTAPFDPPEPAAPAAHVLEGTELENLASVLVDDPLRSVQSLPGVVASDDFDATFAARGLGFSNMGLYLDGVLLSAPFHTIHDVNDGFSLTLVSGDVVDSVSLVTGAAPARYGERTGSVLAIQRRDGSRQEFIGRASLGATGLYGTLEGPMGRAKATSWIVSARKSYLDYVLERIDESGIVLGFHDASARLTHQPRPGQKVSLGFLHGRSRWRSTEDDLRPQDGLTADAGTDLATLQWRWLPSPRSWLDSVAFVARETGRNRNQDGTDDFRTTGSQWGLRLDVTRLLGAHRLEAGLRARRLSQETSQQDFDVRTGSYTVATSYHARSVQAGAYVQDGWTGLRDRLTLTVGARLDHFGETGETVVLPRASATWRLSTATTLLGGFGRYAQFAGFDALFGRRGNPELRAERATHFLVGLEHRLGTTVRVRLEAYDQEMRDLLFTREADWRIEDGRVVAPRPAAPLRNALSGPSRGVEVLVQRRSANGLSGWVAYSFGHARWDSDDGLRFDSDFDQRHTLTVFGTWRLRPTLSLSTKYRFGSGFPVAGFYESRPGGLFLSAERNRHRPETYGRWDVRANKAFLFERWRLTLYVEVINVLDRTHHRYTGLDAVTLPSGRVVLDSDSLFPILPSAGVTVEF